MNGILGFLMILFVVSACGAVRVKEEAKKETKSLFRPDQLAEMQLVVESLQAYEKKVIGALWNENEKIHISAEEACVQYKVAVKRCGHGFRPDHALADSENQWCEDQAAELLAKIQNWAERKLRLCAAMRAAYEKRFEMGKPLVALLLMENSAHVRYRATMLSDGYEVGVELRPLYATYDIYDIGFILDTKVSKLPHDSYQRALLIKEVEKDWRAVNHAAIETADYVGALKFEADAPKVITLF